MVKFIPRYIQSVIVIRVDVKCIYIFIHIFPWIVGNYLNLLQMTHVYASTYELQYRWIVLPYFLFTDMHMCMHVNCPNKMAKPNQVFYFEPQQHTQVIYIAILCIAFALLFRSSVLLVCDYSTNLNYLIHLKSRWHISKFSWNMSVKRKSILSPFIEPI